jgi:hypothetical protein
VGVIYSPLNISNSVSHLVTGLSITERVVYITSGTFAASVLGLTATGNVKIIVANYSLSMVTNVAATGLIAYKAW